MKWALRHPGRFAAASLSGSLDIADAQRWRDKPELMHRVFGDRHVAGTNVDLMTLVDQALLPELFVCCGTKDRLLGSNRQFVERAEAAGVPVTSDFMPGDHSWDYWDSASRTRWPGCRCAATALPSPALGWRITGG